MALIPDGIRSTLSLVRRIACLGGLLLGLGLLVETGKPARAGPPPDLAAYPWLYQRDNRPLDPAEEVIELIAVGDVMLGRGVAAEPEPLAEVAAWLSAADLAMGNLEAMIVTSGMPQPGLYDNPALSPHRLRAMPSAINHLQAAGFDLLGVANNHAFDFGPSGLSQTVASLESAGITAVGLSLDSNTTPIEPALRQVGPVRLAFLAFNAVPDPAGEPGESHWHVVHWDKAEAVAAISAAKAQADAVIVSIHWGQEYSLWANPAQEDAAQAMLAAGADVIIGHHPHVAQEAVVLRVHKRISSRSSHQFCQRNSPQMRDVVCLRTLNTDRLVLYSLGNFAFDQGFDETDQGLALRAFFDQDGLRAAQLLPVWAGPHPQLMTLDEAESLLARVQSSRRLSFTCDLKGCQPVDLTPPLTSGGIFWGGEIDLTGDGIPEKVRRLQEQIVIYRDGAAVWRGDADWRVADLALGDPNDDGRWEAILALWKPDETGAMRSHPFIIGYRKGIYRDIWGGSAVADPIYELELGDVDGDGTQELIVLEATGQAGQRAVTVWDWHGWGFSLRWRSDAGYYRDLIFTPAAAAHPPFVSVSVTPTIIVPSW